jgi:hypothetical protein
MRHVLWLSPTIGSSRQFTAFQAPCSTDGRAAFVAALSAGRVPEMALRLMQSATATLPPKLSPRATQDIRRVAVVVPYVGNRFHTPSVMAVEQCAVLAREGVQVRLFSAQELLPPDRCSRRRPRAGPAAAERPGLASSLPTGVRDDQRHVQPSAAGAS